MLETSRLYILPLTVPALELYLQGNNLFEFEHELTLTNRTVHTNVRRYVNSITLPCMRKLPDDLYLFFTFWLVIEKNTRLIVAELGFKGVPGPTGIVEIGYGTIENARNKGIMTEAVAALIHWAGKRRDISTVLAETDKNNKPSIRVLQKNGFEQYDQKGEMLWWRNMVSQNLGFTPV